MTDIKNVTEKAKKIATGLGVTYGTISILVIALGVLNVLNSIPFASLILELAGLYFIFLNRASILPTIEKVKGTFTAEDIESVRALLPNLTTKEKVK